MRPEANTAVRAVGRERELEAMLELLGDGSSPHALVLTGEPGIGKTTLWETVIAAAANRGLRVLAARAGEAEARLSFVGLADLLDDVASDELAALPSPQRRALEIALLRAEPTGTPPGEQAIALGFLNTLRALAARAPLLVAIDDAPWLDGASAAALAFAARRLGREPVSFIISRRQRSEAALEGALQPITRLEITGLSIGATARMLSDRLGLVVSRRVLQRVTELTGGNPLFALEVARTLADRDPLEIGDEIPVPATVDDLLGLRVTQLEATVRRLALAVALSGGLSAGDCSRFATDEQLSAAIDAGLLVDDGGQIRAAHPLVAAAIRGHSHESERRRIHAELAEAATNDEVAARHLALAADRPDAALASTVAAAAARAAGRGAVEDAVELAERALRLSPPESEERVAIVLALAGYLYRAGELRRLNTLLTEELSELPSGAARAKAHLLLSIAPASIAESEAHLEQALAESAPDPLIRASVLAELAVNQAVVKLERLELAEAWALEALQLAGGRGEAALVQALGWARILQGKAIDDLVGRTSSVRDGIGVAESLERLAGIRLAFRGHIAPARALFSELLAIADERGERWAADGIRHQLCELALRAGECTAASGHLDEMEKRLEGTPIGTSTHNPRLQAVLAAVRGMPGPAEHHAAKTLAGAQDTMVEWDRLEALRAHGIAELFAGRPVKAAERLRAVWEHTRREGVDDPGAFPVAVDLVEALVGSGGDEEASAVTARLAQLSHVQDHPWGLPSTLRCQALIDIAAGGDVEDASATLLEAASSYEQLGLRFDHARTLLALGRSQRRARRWAAARAALEEAAVVFEDCGAEGWGGEARAELARIGGRRPADGGLTPSERSVVDLAANGLANKEIAAALFVSVRTVETHLTHAYAKLGVRSRSQLARRLAAPG